ncbi:hypothetical protein B5807_07317 [Epicoccum nigrum]|uniref:Uncharacterized protein n=1 Tax=Epicoccum nigrum TaxID=105696 RepID=A0A1Y2LXH1_EPING|nr:hypothetical protein B5807_07317 [Epicoccum nigrum]
METAACLLFLSLALGLPQCAITDINVHATVDLDHNMAPLAQKPRQKPLHKPMAPVRRAGERNVLRTARAADLAQYRLDELFGVGDQCGRLANLGHGRSNQVRLHALDVHTVGLQLRAESSGPLLQEGLAARVGCQKRGGEETTEGGHGEDETALALLHAGGDELGHPEGGHAVDDDDVVHLLLRSLVEGHGDVVAQADVVDQDGDVQTIDQLGQLGVVCILVLRKVHGQDLDGGLGAILGGNVGSEGVELGLRARDKDQVVALGREGHSKLLANAIGSTGDEGPGAAGTELGELLARQDE